MSPAQSEDFSSDEEEEEEKEKEKVTTVEIGEFSDEKMIRRHRTKKPRSEALVQERVISVSTDTSFIFFFFLSVLRRLAHTDYDNATMGSFHHLLLSSHSQRPFCHSVCSNVTLKIVT